MPLHNFRELREARVAAEKFLSELKSTFGKLLAQAMGKVPEDPPTLSVLYAQYDSAEKKFKSERGNWVNRIIEKSSRKELDKDEVLLDRYKIEIEALEKQFPLTQAQGDSSSGGGGGQGADAVTLSP